MMVISADDNLNLMPPNAISTLKASEAVYYCLERYF